MEDQRQFQVRLGVRLDDRQARVFALACRNGQVSLTDAKAVTGRTEPEARAVLNALVVDDLLRTLGGGTRYGLPERLRGGLGASMPGQSVSDQVSDGSRDLVTDHVGQRPERNMVIVDLAQASPSPGVNPLTARVIVHLLKNCQVFQFHDTSDTSNFKKRWDAEDNNYLRTHGGNLAVVLHRLEEEDVQRFELISGHIRRVLPVFDRFQLDESYGKVSLRWKAAGTDKTFGAHLTSDGSLRFFALVTLLNLPLEMLPNVLLLDEPELGLHPAAIALVGGMIKSLAVDRQVIVATQSPLLVDVFELDEIVVLDLQQGRTTSSRPDAEGYKRWLDGGFMPGEIWQKNESP